MKTPFRFATIFCVTLSLSSCSGVRTSDYMGVGAGDVERSVAQDANESDSAKTEASQSAEEENHLPKCFNEEIFFRVMNASDSGSSIALKIMGKPVEDKDDLEALKKVLSRPEYEHFSNNLSLRVEEMKVLMKGLISRKSAAVSNEFNFSWVDQETFNDLATRALVKNPSGDVKRYLPRH